MPILKTRHDGLAPPHLGRLATRENILLAFEAGAAGPDESVNCHLSIVQLIAMSMTPENTRPVRS
jgi:hypothetical protein